jgi:hypothetical protein
MVGVPGTVISAAGGSVSIDLVQDGGPRLEDALRRDAIAIRGASVRAVRQTTTEVKLAIRAYIDAHFTGSNYTGNNHRRVANASAQEKTFDDVAGQGQYTGLVYSKFGKRDAGGFVDFLLLHVRGGTVKGNDWIRLINEKAGGQAASVAQTGFFEGSSSDIFFVKSKDGKKLFQLRRYRKGSMSNKAGRTELLATLFKQFTFPARLTGIDAIARRRPELFDRHFREALGEYGIEGTA